MRCFVVGSKELAVRVLEELVKQGHEVTGVLSRDHEDGMRVWLDELRHKSLKARAWQLGIPVFEKISINSQQIVKNLAMMNLDAIFCAFWGEIVKTPVLSLPRLGCFNLHTAYLPRNRGCFPMAWAIIEGEEYAGLTIHRMTPGVDDGPIVAQVAVPIAWDETGESLYRKVTEAGFELFRETLPRIADRTFTLTPQPTEGTYHPRGYPYGGQINPYWDGDKKRRFVNALAFPPFRGHSPEPPRCLKGYTQPGVRVMIGLDCDQPRGIFVASREGSERAWEMLRCLNRLSGLLETMMVPRAFFVGGLFLESMEYVYGTDSLRRALQVDSSLVEIADHGYSHSVLRQVESRPDKLPISSRQAIREYEGNTRLFARILGQDLQGRGYRAPLGHCRGLRGQYDLLDRFRRAGIKYVSSDLRGLGDSLLSPLRWADWMPRQPYRYENGLLEIPSHGWQDTAFFGRSRTPTGDVPGTYQKIIAYYRFLLRSAQQIATEYDRDYFVGLALHPHMIALYDADGCFFPDLYDMVTGMNGSFCKYEDVWEHYRP